MSVTLSFHHFTTGQQDVHALPIPMVYEDTPLIPAQWEYHVLTVDPREEDLPGAAQLNELGKEGWLLVGVFEQRGQRESGRVSYYFVRQQL